jgi:hypothetical protein
MISKFKESTVLLFMFVLISISINIFTYQAVIDLNVKIAIIKDRLLATEQLLNEKVKIIEDFESLTKYNEIPKGK